MTRSIPILLYHHIAPDRDIRPQDLDAQLRGLLEAGYRSLSLDEVLAVVAGQSPAAKGFALTFDDGYLDNWTYAFPVLQKLGIKATMFLVTDRVEESNGMRIPLQGDDTRLHERGPGGFFSWSEAKMMAASGLITFGSHTQSHRNFDRAKAYLDIAKELQFSKALIEKKLGTPCHHLAWPWGDHELSWKELARSAGYSSAAVTRSGANAIGTDPFALQRLNVSQSDPDWLLTRVSLHGRPFVAHTFGLLHGWDRRAKVWWNKESPYNA